MNKIFGSNIYIYQKIQNEIELLYPFPFPNLIEYRSKALQRNSILCCGIPPPVRLLEQQVLYLIL